MNEVRFVYTNNQDVLYASDESNNNFIDIDGNTSTSEKNLMHYLMIL